MTEKALTKIEPGILANSLSGEEWRNHCKSWLKTSLSKAEYCRQHNLSKDNFYYWCKKILSPKHDKLKSSFIPVVSKPSHFNNLVTIELNYPNQLNLSINLSQTNLANLLKELGNATAIIR